MDMWHVPEENVMFKLSSLEIERQHTALLEKKERTLFFCGAVGTDVAPSKRFSQDESEQRNSVF